MTEVVVMPLSVPHVEPLHAEPDRLQVTPFMAESFVSVAVNCCVWPARTMGVAGETVTVMRGGGGGGGELEDAPPHPADPAAMITATHTPTRHWLFLSRMAVSLLREFSFAISLGRNDMI